MNKKDLEKYMDILGLEPNFDFMQLERAYKKKIEGLNINKNISIKTRQTRKELDEAYNQLKSQFNHSKKLNRFDNKNAIYTTNLAGKLGLSFDMINSVYIKNVSLGYTGSLDNLLQKRLNNRDQFIPYRDKIESSCKTSSLLLNIGFDQIVNLYECDCEFGNCNIEILNWLQNLIDLCQSIEQTLNEKYLFSIPDKLDEFIKNNNVTSFIEYLDIQKRIHELCQNLGIEVYRAEFAYAYENTGFSSLVDYLEYNLELTKVIKELHISRSDVDEMYKTYLNQGYKDSKINFLYEVKAVFPLCYKIKQNYYVMKKKYYNIPVDLRPSTFILFMELEAAKYDLNCSTTRMLEKIFLSAKENAFEGNLEDLVRQLTGTHFANSKDGNNQITSDQQVNEKEAMDLNKKYYKAL